MEIFARNPKEREKLAWKCVIVVGCGSVGSAVSEMLVRAGIGWIELIDPEVLAPENIARHMLTQKEVGRPKVEATKERLAAINPYCEIIDGHYTFEEYQKRSRLPRSRWPGLGPNGECIYMGGSPQPDLIVSAVDSYRCESLINGYALKEKIPAVYIGCWGPAQVGEIFYVVPGKTPCYECYASFREKAEIPVDARKYTDPDWDDTRIPGQEGLWANILAITGVAFQVILGLLGLRDVIDHEHPLWLFNFDREGFTPYGVTFATVKKGCAVCDEKLLDGLRLTTYRAASAG